MRWYRKGRWDFSATQKLSLYVSGAYRGVGKYRPAEMLVTRTPSRVYLHGGMVDTPALEAGALMSV